MDIKIGDKVLVECDNSFLMSYVRNCYDKVVTFRGTVANNDSAYPDCLVIIPEELENNKNFFPKIRAIAKNRIKNIFKIEDRNISKLDLDLDKEIKSAVRTFKVESTDKTKQYDVCYNTESNSYTCNCYAGMMNRLCKHVKAVKSKIEAEN